MSQFLLQLINGLNIGSIYALVALGYTMVYGIAKLINFAHGEIIMVGSYTVFVCTTMMGMPIWLSIPVSIVVCAVLGICIEKIAYKPLRSASRIYLLITAIGISFFLQSLFQLIFTANPKSFPTIIQLPALTFGEFSISANYYLTFVVSVVLMIILDRFVKLTKTGRAMRAVSEDQGAAQLMGININRTISITFAIGSALAAVAGILYSSSYPLINPFMGSTLGIKAFIAAVVGGIGIIPGAVLGGFILGIIESLTKAYISSQMTDAIVFLVLIVVLVFKPAGLLGKNRKEKV
ncbi:branched-chain amino acid ABC transporter permease [Anaerorhabdus sp.]|uniref:branched-chain amino acid ABC transporter permease n=1 Tax=Anaerorhabdus sp. TaxID=1872524 RepID=UPI002FC6B459